MIPKETQSRPNVMPRYHCTNCGASLQKGGLTIGDSKLDQWKFCPICGEPIEWDLVIPVRWKHTDCVICGKTLISTVLGYPVADVDYIGSDVCAKCQMEYCTETNCLKCEIGQYPDCEHTRLKQIAMLEKEDGSLGKA